MEQRPVLVLMRGLPSCGRSTTARELAAADGVVLEFDRYFHDHVGEDSARFDWRPELRPVARARRVYEIALLNRESMRSPIQGVLRHTACRLSSPRRDHPWTPSRRD